MPTVPVPTRTALKRPLPLLRMRRNAATLTPDQLKTFRGAIKAAYAIDDNRGYNHFAGLHGLPLPIECVHSDEFWLPWHRAYLYFFEMSLRSIEPTVTLPWWDWTAGGLPAAYTTPARGNPLTSAAIPQNARRPGDPARTFRDGPGPLPTPAQLQSTLDKSDWDDFSSSLRGLHNNVHTSFAGTMRHVELAAYDPIFWAHHTFVDRAWRLWQLDNSTAIFDADFLEHALAPFPMTVKQAMSVTRLGYDYARSTISIPFNNKLVPPPASAGTSS